MTPLGLTDDQLATFDAQGYLVLPGRIPADLIDRLRDAADRWAAVARASHGDPDVHFAPRPNGQEVMWRIDYLHGRGDATSLDLLGAPEMLALAERLAGPNFVPTYESLVVKEAGDGAAVPWHQDAVHPRNWRIVNIDVYLDASLPGQGALRVVPGSHRGAVDVCRLRDEHGWNPPGAVEVAMQPGDVLLHDVMLVHGSPPSAGGPLRRTIYYEFRAAEQIVAEGPWDLPWIERRMRLVPLALAEHRAARPDDTEFPWHPDPVWRPTDLQERSAELRIVHEVHTRGSWCSAGDVAVADTAVGTPATAIFR